MNDQDAMDFFQSLREEPEVVTKPAAIPVPCPNCGRKYKLSGDKAGKRFKCRDCETVVTIPGGSPRKKVKPSPSVSAQPDEIHELGSIHKGVAMEYWAMVTELVAGITLAFLLMKGPSILPIVLLLLILAKGLRITSRIQCLSATGDLMDSTLMGLSLFSEIALLVLGGISMIATNSPMLMALTMIGVSLAMFASSIFFAACLKKFARSLGSREVSSFAGHTNTWLVVAGGLVTSFTFSRMFFRTGAGLGLFVVIILIGSLMSYGRLLDGMKKRLQSGAMGTN